MEDTEVLRQKIQQLETRVRMLEQGKILFIPGSASEAATDQLYVDATDSNRVKQK